VTSVAVLAFLQHSEHKDRGTEDRWEQKTGDSRQGKLVSAQPCTPVSSRPLCGAVSKNKCSLRKSN